MLVASVHGTRAYKGKGTPEWERAFDEVVFLGYCTVLHTMDSRVRS
jgi:hypothetical protein